MAVPTPTAEDRFLAHVAAMPEEWRECRGGQHRFNTTDALRVVDSTAEAGARPIKGERVYARRTVECDRCGKVRHDYFRITSRNGHQMCVKIGVYYEKLEGYDLLGNGVIPGNKALVLGMALELNAPIRGRGRPRKAAE